MSCCQCQGVEEEFNPRVARRQMRRYRKRGPKKTTSWLIEAIVSKGLPSPSLLDIGGGIGEIQHELVDKAGAEHVTNVDASSAYQDRARDEATRKGYTARAEYVYGDFVDVEDRIVDADIVTLDRVICCYDDVDGLVMRSAEKARRLYGLVYPRETWWTRLGFRLLNTVQRARRASFRAFLHPERHVHGLLVGLGFERRFHRHDLVWKVAVYERVAES